MIVNGDGTKKTKTIDPTQRTPRRIEMLTADDDESNSDDSAKN